MMNHSRWAFVGNMSSAISWETNQPHYMQMVDKYFLSHSTCASTSPRLKVAYADLRGLFMSTYIILGLAVLYSCARAFYRLKLGVAEVPKEGDTEVSSVLQSDQELLEE
eukprot:2865363-Pyramimonas_sp.AAC.1